MEAKTLVTTERAQKAEAGAEGAARGAAVSPRASPPAAKTLSGIPLMPFYGPEDVSSESLPRPGEYPYTRGIHETMYRGKLWTMRQFSGFGSARQTNERFKFLLEHGESGLSVAFDMPTLMGYDSDAAVAAGEVGRCGVAVSSIEDMHTLLEGIPLDRVSTSMTINGPAAILLAMYLVVAEDRGISPKLLRGTIQNDIFKEYHAQHTWLLPPQPSLRIITDTMRYCAEHVPQWNTISISGYHIREAGSTAVQELGFTLADGFAYVEAGIAAGLDVDDFAPRLSFFFNAHNDFFEEIAKYRAARRMWARTLREKYGAKDPKSWKMRFHAQTAGCTLTAQQPENNIVRVAYQALAAVLGGCQSLHTNSMDETLALPSARAARLALRTQQMIAHETGVPAVADPFGGSYFVEALTDRMEAEAWAIIRRIEGMGGMLEAVRRGAVRREIARAAAEEQRLIERGEQVVVGVNRFTEEEQHPVEILTIGPEVEEEQAARLKTFKARRDATKVCTALNAVEAAARGASNFMQAFVEAARQRATLGEICDRLRSVLGTHREEADF